MHKRKLVTALVSLFVVGAGLFAGTSAATAASIPGNFPSGAFHIRNTHSGLCLVVGSFNNAVLGDCNNNQDFSSVWVTIATRSYGGATYFQLENGLHECLGLSQGSTAIGTQLVAKQDCNLNGDQFWVPGNPANHSFVSLLNYKADMAAKCVGCGGDVGVQHAGTASGDLVRLAPPNSNGDQEWQPY